MYDCRCERDGKKLGRIARPPVSNMAYTHRCDCGNLVRAGIEVSGGGLIYASGECCCGRSFQVFIGYVVEIKCRHCKKVNLF